jgi:hypothetical protein
MLSVILVNVILVGATLLCVVQMNAVAPSHSSKSMTICRINLKLISILKKSFHIIENYKIKASR